MRESHASYWSTAWALLLVGGNIQTRCGSVGVEAFVPAPPPSFSALSSFRTYEFPVAVGATEEDREPSKEASSNAEESIKPGVGRRGTIKTLLGSAVSFAAWDIGLNVAGKATGAAGTAVMAAGGGLYERVIAFGNKYRGAAIASEELTSWIATQTVAVTPELRAWLSAQRNLQMIRKTTMAATAVVTRAKTTKTAAVAAGGGVLEEGILAAGATAALKNAINTADDASTRSSGSAGTNTETNTVLEATRVADDRDSKILPTKTILASKSEEEDRLLASDEKNIEDK